MNKKLLSLLIFFSVFFAVNPGSAQNMLFNGNKYKLGFVTGSGIQYIGQLIGNDNHHIALKTNYYYQVTFYQLQYYISILRKKTFGIDILAQPQYNLAKYRLYPVSTEYLKAYEFGLNLGFVVRENVLSDLLSFYLSASSGPHYASGTPHRQSSGFLFSNNVSLGFNLKLYKSLYADIRAGIRHMSNAGIKIPNAGINDMTINEGFLVSF
jgi:hypothetical protein